MVIKCVNLEDKARKWQTTGFISYWFNSFLIFVQFYLNKCTLVLKIAFIIIFNNFILCITWLFFCFHNMEVLYYLYRVSKVKMLYHLQLVFNSGPMAYALFGCWVTNNGFLGMSADRIILLLHFSSQVGLAVHSSARVILSHHPIAF